MIDYHVHPGISIDAEDFSIFEYCRRAHQLGLKEICFTPHYEFDPVRANFDWFVRVGPEIKPMNGPWLDGYLDDVNRAKEHFSRLGLQVKAGVEIGFDRGLEEAIAAIVERYSFDFVLGSVHCVDHVAISSSAESDLYYPETQLPYVIEEYFTVLSQAIESGLFDSVGHLDIYRRHGLRHFGPKIFEVHEPYINDIFDSMKKQDIIFEINTSSLRHGQEEFYPSRAILAQAKKAGITEITVGSDAHRLGELGSGIKEALSLAGEMGFTPVTYNKRQRQAMLTVKEG